MTDEEIASLLREVASDMEHVGKAMTRRSEPRYRQHGAELIGAAGMARQWVSEIEVRQVAAPGGITKC
jgi:hypothetical protein